jgi:GT2 family glycosyltransferase
MSATRAELPAVSIIIPVYNGERTLPGLIESLRGLDYPQEKISVFIIDNNSTDRTAQVIKSSGFTSISFTREQNSYASRNVGIGLAQGEILAFTDADCRVDPAWIREGVSSMIETGADMAAGALCWTLARETISGKYSRAMFGNQREMVEKNQEAAAGNLFIARRVFEKMGLFDERIPFGEDTGFTSRAAAAGFKLVFCPAAKVAHGAHDSAASLYRKWWRTGFGLALKTGYYGRGKFFFRDPRWYAPGVRQFLEFRAKERLSLLEQVKGFFLVWLTKIACARGNREGYRKSRGMNKDMQD